MTTALLSTSPIPTTPINSTDRDTYALISKPNITQLQFGPFTLKTWYGTSVYFSRLDHNLLGFKKSHSLAVGQEGDGVKKVGQQKTEKEINDEEPWLDKLYVCDYCFKYTDILGDFQKHYEFCNSLQKKYVFGKMCYRDNKHTIRRIRGMKHKLFCQNLSLFTKLYLDNKSVFFDVDHFTYYVIYDNLTLKPLGFFSKEQLSLERNNLACILVFPPYQRQHLGRKLIEFSYALSWGQQYLISGPEKPLSPFGLVGYLRYWSDVIVRLFLDEEEGAVLKDSESFSIEMISQLTGFRYEDVDMTLRYMEVLLRDDRGEEPDVVLVKDKIIQWAKENKILDGNKKKITLIKKECLLL